MVKPDQEEDSCEEIEERQEWEDWQEDVKRIWRWGYDEEGKR